MAGSVFLFTISATGNAKRLQGGQNIKQLSKILIEMEGYLRTSTGGISPLMLLSWITLRKAQNNSGNSYSRVSVLSSERDSDILTCCFSNFKLCNSGTNQDGCRGRPVQRQSRASLTPCQTTGSAN